MSKFKVGDRVRLVECPISGHRDIGEEFVVAEPGEWECTTGTPVVSYVDRTGYVTHCPTRYWELVETSPVRTVTRKEIVPGQYGRVDIEDFEPGQVIVELNSRPCGSYSIDASELRDAARIFNELADALDASQ